MVHPVLFFVGTGQLMLFDHIVDVIIDGCTAHDTHLGTAVHHLLVQVEAGLLVLDINAVGNHFVQVVPGLFIDDFAVVVDGRIQVDLGFVHMQEGVGIAHDHLPGLFAAHYVIGKSRHLGGQLAGGANGLERSYNCHVLLSFVSLLISGRNSR